MLRRSSGQRYRLQDHAAAGAPRAHGTCSSGINPPWSPRMRRQLAVLCLAALAACSDQSAGPDQPGGDPPVTPAPAGPLPSVGGCQVFPADNAWNRDVSADPVHPNSSALIGQMLPGSRAPPGPGNRRRSTTASPTPWSPPASRSCPSGTAPTGRTIPTRATSDRCRFRSMRPIEGGSTAEPEPGLGRSPPARGAPGRLRALRAVQHRP